MYHQKRLLIATTLKSANIPKRSIIGNYLWDMSLTSFVVMSGVNSGPMAKLPKRNDRPKENKYKMDGVVVAEAAGQILIETSS